MTLAMPTHWESSKRPLFVKTVLVDGSRHAILSHEDPLGQCNVGAKGSRPNSARSTTSGGSLDSDSNEKCKKSENSKRKERRRGPSDLQSCLVKLRLVLATQENKRNAKNKDRKLSRGKNKRKAKGNKHSMEKKQCDWEVGAEVTNGNAELNIKNNTESFKYDNNCNIAIASFFTSAENDVKNTASEIEVKESQIGQILEEKSLPTMNIQPDHDVSWNTISAESYFTRPFFNRLSERVLQWLDMANKTKKHEEQKTESVFRPKMISSSRSSLRLRNLNLLQCSSEDNADEVKHEEDVDTALSKDVPKFSQDLNRLHQLKAEIPVKESTGTADLQESIVQSFTTIVSIRSGKYVQKPSNSVPNIERRSRLIRQKNIELSSDEDSVKLERITGAKSNQDRRKRFESSILNNQNFGAHLSSSPISPRLQTRIPWLRDYRSGSLWPIEKSTIKPQLHIFIPDLPEESDFQSDNDSVLSDMTS